MPSDTDEGQAERPERSGDAAAVVGSPSQRRALAVGALISTLALLWLSLPVASGLFLGTLLAFSLLQVHERLTRRLRSGVAAVMLALASAVVTIGGLSWFSYFAIARGTVAANSVVHAFDPGGPLNNVLARVQTAIDASPIGPIDLAARLRDAAATATAELTRLAAVLAGLTANAALTLFFAIMTTFFVLRHWPSLIARAERMLPLHPAHTRIVLAEFQRVGREVFIGTLLTGLAQGVLAGIGYLVAGVPQAALLGTLTAICSLVPVIGTLLVWVPIGLVLMLTSHLGAGVFVLAWGTVMVVVLCDYVIRPKLVGGQGYMPTLITFIALFGGVEVFGLIGLIVGPVIASVALALLRTYDVALSAARS